MPSRSPKKTPTSSSKKTKPAATPAALKKLNSDELKEWLKGRGFKVAGIPKSKSNYLKQAIKILEQEKIAPVKGSAAVKGSGRKRKRKRGKDGDDSDEDMKTGKDSKGSKRRKTKQLHDEVALRAEQKRKERERKASPPLRAVSSDEEAENRDGPDWGDDSSESDESTSDDVTEAQDEANTDQDEDQAVAYERRQSTSPPANDSRTSFSYNSKPSSKQTPRRTNDSRTPYHTSNSASNRTPPRIPETSANKTKKRKKKGAGETPRTPKPQRPPVSSAAEPGVDGTSGTQSNVQRGILILGSVLAIVIGLLLTSQTLHHFAISRIEFCESDSSSVVVKGTGPSTCQPCPKSATCAQGKAHCPDNQILQGTRCVADKKITKMAYEFEKQADHYLATLKGYQECGMVDTVLENGFASELLLRDNLREEVVDESSEDYARFEDSYSLMLENLREKETGIEMEARGGKTYFRMSRDVGFPHKPWTCMAKSFLWKNFVFICFFSTAVSAVVFFWSKWRAKAARDAIIEGLVLEVKRALSDNWNTSLRPEFLRQELRDLATAGAHDNAIWAAVQNDIRRDPRIQKSEEELNGDLVPRETWRWVSHNPFRHIKSPA